MNSPCRGRLVVVAFFVAQARVGHHQIKHGFILSVVRVAMRNVGFKDDSVAFPQGVRRFFAGCYFDSPARDDEAFDGSGTWATASSVCPGAIRNS